jgi:hypothetical protein
MYNTVLFTEKTGLDDARKKVQIMYDIITLFRTMYKVFSRSSLKKDKPKDLANATECDAYHFDH